MAGEKHVLNREPGTVADRAFLAGRPVAVSVSESPDLPVLGLGLVHLQDAAVEVARHLLVAGAELVYGGDLRQEGLTRLLAELVARHRRDAGLSTPEDTAGDARVLTNFLAQPVHAAMADDDLAAQTEDFGEVARIVLLDTRGRELSPARRRPPAAKRRPADWAASLTAMRRAATDHSWARLALGGKVEGYRGRMPGIAEEVAMALSVGMPVFLMGGFGGCTRDIAEALGLAPPSPARPLLATRTWPGIEEFLGKSGDALRNGLDAGENARLAETVHVDEAVALVLRGMRRVCTAEARPVEPALGHSAAPRKRRR